MAFATTPEPTPPTNRIAAIDGLRVIAFLLIFFNHTGHPAALPFLAVLNAKGWAGVDLFFAISAFTLFTSLEKDRKVSGRISVTRFLMRRLVRIYPLMAAFAALMLVIAVFDGTWIGLPQVLGFAGLILGIDNVIWVTGLKTVANEIPGTAHLWSLSFELQLYLMVPALFIAHQRLPLRQFLWLLLAIVAYGAAARMVVFGLGAKHPLVYMIPIFRPDSFLAGVAIWAIKPKWNWWWSAIAGAASLLAYPALAIVSAGLIDCALRAPLLNALFSIRAIAWFGFRGYGLYVFHFPLVLLGIYLAGNAGLAGDRAWLFWFVFAFVGTLISAALSYRFFEAPARHLAVRLGWVPPAVAPARLGS